MNDPFLVHACVPSSGLCRTRFAVALCGMIAYIMRHTVEGYDPDRQGIVLRMAEGSVISQNREQLVLESLGAGATHILFLDDDMTFPPDVIHRLAAHHTDIVGCNYPYRIKGGGFTAMDWDDRPIPLDETSTGLEEVKVMGLGCCLINAAVFQALDHPWFGIYWNPRRQKFTTEDGPFLHMARQAGFHTYLDHDTSKHLAHMGVYTYDWTDMP